MAAMMAPPKAEKHAAEVTEHLAQAAGKIRVHDLTIGGLLLAVGLLGYTAAMMIVDKYLDLDAWMRQLGWLGLLALLGGIGYRFLWKPLRNAINPLYAAKLVEETVPDAKNSIVNWVDLHDETMPESVRNAVRAKAAKHLAHADLNRAVESRVLLYAGCALAALVVLMAGLFLAFKPTVFGSLINRTLNPFSSSVIATRTTLTLLQPVDGDAAITAGEPITISVRVEGREPDVTAPDRLRVLLRHNPADPNAEEINLEPAGSREWSVRVPQHLVQNGFWYRVAGGDGSTAEHRITVKPRPVFTDFEIKYEYPKYLNVADETSRDPHLEAYRGTVVTILAKANRDLKDGRMIIADVPMPIAGEVNGNTLKIRFQMMENGTYRLFFTSTGDETNTDSPPFQLRVITDTAPTITFKPTQPEMATLPLNGLLTVDADVSDDFGIDSVILRMRVENGPILKAKPYRDGKSFKRDADNTWPTSLEYKDSVKLDSLTLESGALANLKPDAVIEYWLEATDNCTVPKANVCKSKVLKVRLAPPVEEDAKKMQQAKDDQRKADEDKSRKNQDTKNSGEKRPQKGGPQDKKNNPEKGESQPGGEKEPGAKPESDPTQPPMTQPNKGGSEPKTEQPPEKKTDPANPMNKGTEAGTQNPDDKDIQKKAEQVKNELDKFNNDPGEAKSGDAPKSNDPPSDPANRKDGPKDQGQPEPKPDQPMGGDPSQEKNAGEAPKPMNPADPKAGSEKKPDGAAEEKPMPKNAGEKPPMDPMTKEQPGEEKGSPEAGDAKSQTPPKPGESKAPDKSKPQSDPNAQGKPETGDSASGDKPAGEQPKTPGENKASDKGGEKPAPGDKTAKSGDSDLDQAVRDLESENPGKREAAKQKIKEATGQDSDKLFRDLESKDQSVREQAKKDIDELAKKQKQQQGRGGEQKPNDAKDVAKDLKSGSPYQQKAAQDKIDKANADAAKKEAEKLAKDLQSNDPKTKADAEKKLQDLKDQIAKDQKSGGGEKKPLDPKELEDAAKDLASGDPMKQDAARDKLDKNVGPDARKKMEEMAKDLQSNDPKTKADAEKKLQDMKDQMAKDQKAGGGDQKPLDPKELADAAKDLNSTDPKKQQDARDKLDKSVGPDARKKMEQLAKDSQSTDPKTKADAEKKLQDMKDQLAKDQKAGGGDQKPLDPKELEDAAKDLTSKDDAKRKAAEEKLDKMVGEQARKEGQKMMEDLQSGDPEKQAAAQKKLDDLMKKADEMAKDAKPPTKEEVDRMKDLAKDLNSKDKEKREQAEKALDDKLGKENRDKLQEQMKDQAKADEPLSPELQKKIEDMAKAGNPANKPKSGGPPVGGNDSASKPSEANADFAKRSGQLQLETLKKERANKELLKKLGWTQEDYDNFVKGYEKMLNRPDATTADTKNPATPPQVDQRNTNTAGRVETRVGPATGSPQASDTANAAPGYSDAQKAFLDKARKAQEKK